MENLECTKFGDALLVSVGPDDLVWEPHSSIRWMVYSYTSGSYEGQGEAFVAYDDGSFAIESLGHCSCNGPEDHIPEKGDLTRAEVMTRLGRDPNGDVLKVGEWDIDTFFNLWEGVEFLGFINPTKESVRRVLVSESRVLREYVIREILPEFSRSVGRGG